MITKKILTWVVFILLIGTLSPLHAAEPAKVAVVPFKMNADRDLSFLRDGIVDMLTTRLSWEDKVVVIPKAQVQQALQSAEGAMTENSARQLAGKLGADFVLFGSLTVFGESVSMDAKMVDAKGTKPPISVFNQSKGMDDVIPQVNQFAADINEKVFGRATARPQQVAAPGPAPQQAPGIFDHPDKLLGGNSTQDPEYSELNPNFILTRGRKETSAFRERYKFDKYIKSLAIGDVDGDGLNETVFLSPTEIIIFRNTEGRFLKIKEIAGVAADTFLSVDVADINKNGKAEIFVTDLHATRGALQSFVLEWNGNDFARISDNKNWYYRVVDIPARGRVLHGQKKGVSDAFLPGIDELQWQGGDYAPVSRLRVPAAYNVYGVMFGDVVSEGSDRLLAFDEEDYLLLLSPSGEKEWKSDEAYGGSTEYVLTGAGAMESKKEEDQNRTFLSQRILVRDLDDDGKQEVIVVKNQGTGSHFFKRFRNFVSSEIIDLSWDGLGLTQNWKTRKIPDYVSDFAIDDFDNDGQDELVAVMVKTKGTTLIVNPTSYAIWYDLVGLDQKEEKEKE